MPAVYQKFGMRFLYPENWDVTDEETDDWPRTVTLQSRHTAFWTLVAHPPGGELRPHVKAVVDSIQAEFPDLEVIPVKETLGGVEVKGVDICFFYLDLLVEAKIRCLKTPSACLVWHSQAESKEFDEMDLVFQAIATSMLENVVPLVE
jgi:hypothetical protein